MEMLNISRIMPCYTVFNTQFAEHVEHGRFCAAFLVFHKKNQQNQGVTTH